MPRWTHRTHRSSVRSVSGGKAGGLVILTAAALTVGVVPASAVGAGVAPTAASETATRAPVSSTLVRLPLAGVDGAALAGSSSPATRAALQAGSLKPAVVTAPTATKLFAVVGVSAPEPLPAGSRVVVRVREASGWGAWTALDLDDHAPDPGSAEAVTARVGTDPLVTSGATGVQVRIDTTSGTVPTGTTVDLLDSPQVAADANLVATRPRASLNNLGGAPMPPIILRSGWGANESMRGHAPEYSSTIKVGFVHHTASTSNYSQSQAAAQMRSLYAWYTQGLHYSDLAYNFLVDRFGRLYEGRAGGLDRPVVGGHTAGFNQNTFAISAIGNFDTFNPSASDASAITSSISALLAWKLGLYHRDPMGTTTLVSNSGAGTSKYKPGQTARTNVIEGHGEIGSTACPGRYLRQYLPQIRQQARALLGPAIMNPVASPKSLGYGNAGSTVTISAATSEAVSWRATISSCQATVRTLTGTQNAKGPLSLSWDLRGADGNPVPPGTYRVDLTGTAANGKAVYPASVSVVVTATNTSPPSPCGASGTFTVAGAGWGHGVGLSQYGALGMAKEGSTAEQIVTHYYTGTQVAPVPDDVDIRVGLLAQVSSAQLRTEPLGAGGGGLEVQVGANPAVLGSAVDAYTLGVSGSNVTVTKADGTSLGAASNVAVRWSGTRVPGAAGSVPTLLNVAGPGESFVSAGHRYRYGWLDVSTVKVGNAYKLNVVNPVRLHDEYLLGIAEVQSSWPAAALQAQVLASRSYGLAKLAGGVRSSCNCHVDDGGGPNYDQTFAGWTAQTRAQGQNWIDAVAATAAGPSTGLAILSAGVPITAFYGSSTGGRTESSADVWGGSLPYAVSVDDHWSLTADNPNRAWTRTVTQSAMAAAFGLGDVASVSITAHTNGGAIRTVVATASNGTTKSLSGTALRSKLGLPSTAVSAITGGAGNAPAPPVVTTPPVVVPPVAPKPTVQASLALRSPAVAAPISGGGRFAIRATTTGLQVGDRVVLTLNGRAVAAAKVGSGGSVDIEGVPAFEGAYRLRWGAPGAYHYTVVTLKVHPFGVSAFSEGGRRDRFVVATGNWSRGTVISLTRYGRAVAKARVTSVGSPVAFVVTAQQGTYQARVGSSRSTYVYGTMAKRV